MRRSFSVIGGFFIRTLLWLVPSVAIWFWLGDYLSAPIAWLAGQSMTTLFPGWVYGYAIEGSNVSLHTIIPAPNLPPGVFGELAPEISALKYGFGLPLIAALLLASNARGTWWKLPLSALILLPFQAWGRCCFDYVARLDGGRIHDDLTEEKTAYLFARAWNRLNPEGFLALLAPDARYASQWVSEELVGAFAIATCLRNKMAVVRDKARKDPSAEIRVEMGLTSEGIRGRPCAFMTQGQFEEVQAAVVFELEGGRIVRNDLCIPQLLGAVRKGVFSL